jgi:uncharacterized protein (DUF2126 family)/transglutaminase-like putative cysteine protease
MSIHVALSHSTAYHYDRLVNLSPQIVRLRPAPHSRTRILSYSLKVEPAQHFINWQQDPMGNYQARLVFPEKTDHFKVTVDVVAEMSVLNPFDFFLEPSAETCPFDYEAGEASRLAPFLVRDAVTPAFGAYLAAHRPTAGARTIDFLVGLNQHLWQDISYLIRMEPGVQTPEETLSKASGSCRDSAWLLVQLLRHMGFAARFVSGYLIQLEPDVKAIDGPVGAEKDFTDLHAWCEVYLPGAGWIGLDPTSGLMAGEGHIPLAASGEPSDAAPITGAVDDCEVEFEHHMSVQRIHESPRTTKPYTPEQWAAIEALGHAVDKDLLAGDVRLTMGGEPTFIADRDRQGEEWNTAALGPTKRGYATELIKRLHGHYGQGGFLHFGQGKWYPGEQLPRWALSLVWAKDGRQLWRNPDRFADERGGDAFSTDHAQAFMTHLCERLGVADETLMPGYEDTWYYLWRERRLPINVDPFDSRVDDEMERARLRAIFKQGLASVVGYALPIRKNPVNPLQWQTGNWYLRDDRLYLIPGDSPMGYRLPLDSLPWSKGSDRQSEFERDPFDSANERPTRTGSDIRPQDRNTPQRYESARDIVRTAMCAQVRDGTLYVFMPPLFHAEDYIELLTHIEDTADELDLKLVLEGYPAPKSPLLKQLQVTPDPGVIEVNIHPSENWGELVDRTQTLYEQARQTHLSTEKFMVDGRHTGTGGGNHFVLGGATPADSPFLRRPDLLASLIRYWNNHPSLSYLFSGLFIGPTSQAPRIDEARNDQVHELEIAFEELKRNQARFGQEAPPWLIDRMLRNLLVDVTGNTHRCEFSIDKLYSPDSSTGRLGLLELRAFEMPPHAEMSLVQQLLLRSLVARFWQQPYEEPLQRWGTELHDRFMLPTFVRMDFEDIIDELQRAGYPMQQSWFAPHFEFRFPRIGELEARGVELTLRNALEPWHVMGEEGSSSGAVRYVDSSLERLEAHVSGFNAQRYTLLCNGEQVPLQATGRVGEYAAGVRYRAWQPASCLHPTIASDSPLVFDLYDNWSKRSLGGCQYHVAHPGGRSYDTFPINNFEAESRRLARFFRMGHTAGTLTGHTLQKSLEHPFTLDLRRSALK